MYNTRKRNKKIRTVLIFTLICVFLCSNLAYSDTSLRVPSSSKDQKFRDKFKTLCMRDRAKALINEKKPLRVALAFLSKPTDKSRIAEPLGLESIKGYLRNTHGDNVATKILVSQPESKAEPIIEMIKQENPDILGLSLFFGTMDDLDKIMVFTRNIPAGQRPLIVLGNVLATFNYKELLNKYPEVVIVKGEGEIAFSGLISYRKGEILLSDVPNVIYQGTDGKPKFTDTQLGDLSDIGNPSRDILPLVIETGAQTFLEAARGCDGYCTFCNRRKFFGGIRRERPVNDVLDDIAYLSQNGVKKINFVDEDFIGGTPERTLAIADGILDLKSKGMVARDLVFYASIRADSVYCDQAPDRENEKKKLGLKRLKESGLVTVFMGVESGSKTQSKRYAKPASLEENKEALEILKELDITAESGFIMFDPLVTLDELEENSKFLRETGLMLTLAYPFHQLRVQEGSAMVHILRNKGLLTGEYDSDWLVYKYEYGDSNVAGILYTLKNWEQSSFLFLWTLKVVTRSATFGNLSIEEQRRLEAYTSMIKVSYLDLLEDLIKAYKNERRGVENIVRRHSDKLILLYKDFLNDLEAGNITIDADSFRKTIYSSLIRETIIWNFFDTRFDLQQLLHSNILSNIQLNKDFMEICLSDLIKDGDIEEVSDGVYIASDKFPSIKDLLPTDLAKPAKIIFPQALKDRIAKMQSRYSAELTVNLAEIISDIQREYPENFIYYIDDKGHGLAHSLDFIEEVFDLLSKHNIYVDHDAMAIACLFHDITSLKDYNSDYRRYHHLRSAKVARAYLRGNGYSELFIDKVYHMIAEHGHKGNPSSLDAQAFYLVDQILDVDIQHTLMTKDGRVFYNSELSFEERLDTLISGNYINVKLDKVTLLLQTLIFRSDYHKLLLENKELEELFKSYPLLRDYVVNKYEVIYSPRNLLNKIFMVVDDGYSDHKAEIERIIYAIVRTFCNIGKEETDSPFISNNQLSRLLELSEKGFGDHSLIPATEAINQLDEAMKAI